MKKGFTLIELLAVIVILAIIALIATPILLDIIEDSKNSSIRESANMYKSAAENAIATSAMNDGLEDGTYIIDNKGNLKYKDKTIKVDIKNYNFEYGILVIEQGQIKDIKLIQNDKVTTGKELNKIDKWDGKTIKEVTADSNGIYHITTSSELAWVAQKVNSGETFAGKTISLDASLDLGGRYDKEGNKLGTEWIPIGKRATKETLFPFKGTFEGNNNVISGIYINKSIDKIDGDYSNRFLGLFGYIDNSIIKNIIIKNSYIKGYINVGVLSGWIKNGSIINNIIVKNITIDVSKQGGVVFGVADNSDLKNLYSYDSEIHGEDTYIGGIASSIKNNSTLSNAYSNSFVKNDGTAMLLGTGGILGSISSSSADNLISEATVTGFSGIGGMIGQFQDNSLLKDSVSYAKVIGTNLIGGAIGVVSSYNPNNTLENIKSYATIEGSGEYIGGVIGKLSQGNTYLTNIYSKSNVKGKDKVGGIIGGFQIGYDTTLNYKSTISESMLEGETNKGELWGYIDSTSTINKMD